MGLLLWLVGSGALMVAVRKGRGEFRSKGYLRRPSGTRWFRFLLLKQYDAFDDSGTRFYFGITHMCLIGAIVAFGAVIVLGGCNLFFQNIDALPGGAGLPKAGMPK